MSCCWKPASKRQNTANFGQRMPQPDGSGTIPLAAYPDCRQPHNGAHRDSTVYLVGWRTEHEKLFLDSDAKQAVIYRNGIDPTVQLTSVPASQICNQAILDLHAAE